MLRVEKHSGYHEAFHWLKNILTIIFHVILEKNSLRLFGHISKQQQQQQQQQQQKEA